MLLVDTSIWVDHFRKGVPALVQALQDEQVLSHPFVLGELACGNIRNRGEVLGLLRELPFAATATDEEALTFIEQRNLMGRGVGYIDIHLLASAVLTSASLWTDDRRLMALARELGVANS